MKLQTTNYKLQTDRSGFTLVEVIIYIGIFASMVAFVAGIVWRVGDSVSANRGRTGVETEADFAMSKIKWAMAGARSIDQPAATSTGSILSVTRYNVADDPIVFALTNGSLTMSRAGGTAVPITSPNIRVNTFSATHNAAAINIPESVQLVMSMAASSSEPGVFASTTLQTTFYLRK